MDAILVEVRRSSGNRNGQLMKNRYWVKESVTITGRQSSCVRIQMLYASAHSSSLGTFLSKAFIHYFILSDYSLSERISFSEVDLRSPRRFPGEVLFVPIWDVEDMPAVT